MSGASVSTNDFIAEIVLCQNMAQSWDTLTKAMKGFGFDRMIYGRKLHTERSSHQNFTDAYVLSTYGDAVDAYFVDQRHYANNFMVNWVVANAGAKSWRHSHERYDKDEMSPEERKLYEFTRNHGIKAGYTYGCPIRPNVRSGFGLCFRDGVSQSEVDDVWEREQDNILPLLNVFDIAASTFANFSEQERLSEKEIECVLYAAEGRTADEIAELLGRHRRTVEMHLTNAREKLGVGTTLQAVLKATRQGQI